MYEKIRIAYILSECKVKIMDDFGSLFFFYIFYNEYILLV